MRLVTRACSGAQAVAAGVRPQLARTREAGEAMVRRAVKKMLIPRLTCACSGAQAVAAGVRPQLARTREAGEGAVRRAVLSVAQQQRLAACGALLREVALAYGFALHIAEDVGDEDTGAA